LVTRKLSVAELIILVLRLAGAADHGPGVDSAMIPGRGGVLPAA
jgi:hypothetical protein